VYANANVVQISPASTNPAFTDHAASRGWTNVLRTAGRDDAQGVVAGEFLAETYRGKNVAIVHDGSTYGKLTAESTTRAMNAGGVREVMSETIGQGDKDFSTLISALKSAKVDAVYLGTYHTEGALIIRQARAAGLGAQFIGADAFVTSEFWSIAGDAGEGMLMTFAPDPRRHEAARDVVARFRAQGIDPEGYTLYTYAAFEVWAEAVRRAGTTDAANVAAALRQNTYTTVLGDLRFDAKGDVIDPAYVFYRWSTGRYSEVPAS
jgi:branched-chain amino acid transport system substrate-binding protein